MTAWNNYDNFSEYDDAKNKDYYHHPNDLYVGVIDVLINSRREVHNLDNTDTGAIYDGCYLLDDTV